MGPHCQLPRVNSVTDKITINAAYPAAQEVNCYPNMLPPSLHTKRRATLFRHINDILFYNIT